MSCANQGAVYLQCIRCHNFFFNMYLNRYDKLLQCEHCKFFMKPKLTIILLTLFLINRFLKHIFHFIKYRKKSFNKLICPLFFKQCENQYGIFISSTIDEKFKIRGNCPLPFPSRSPNSFCFELPSILFICRDWEVGLHPLSNTKLRAYARIHWIVAHALFPFKGTVK